MLYSNLGGQGPDFNAPRSIRFVNVASLVDIVGVATHLDLEVTNRTAYTPYDPNLNSLGGQGGRFAQINLACDHEVGLLGTLCRMCDAT